MNAMNQSWMLLIARILFGPLFIVVGIRSLMNFAGTAGYYAKLGFPVPEAMVWLSIIIHIVGGIMLVVGWKTQWASWLLLAASAQWRRRLTSVTDRHYRRMVPHAASRPTR